MAQAVHIRRLPASVGKDAEIAREYGVDVEVIRQIRNGEGYNGVALGERHE
jgi:hypothetical protein